MSVVKINVLQVPEGRGDVLEQRFATRAGEVDKVDGFESFELLRPTEGTDRYLVITKWRDEDAFQAWMNSAAFQKGHARAGGGEGAEEGSAESGGHPHSQGGHPGGHPGGGEGGHGGGHPGGGEGGHGGGHPGGEGQPQPAATGSELWGFEVVLGSSKEQ
jgi:heme oxygenase (mycobilin-producing)